MAEIVVVGAGVGGLGSALALSRAGHRVTVVERDATPLPADADGAFRWDRRGAPQVRHSHALLARLRNLLRDHYPDVLTSLLEAGATELDFVAMMPPEMDPTPVDGDADLVALACRRTTFEWVLRRTVLADPAVSLVDGVAVTGLVTSGPVAAVDGDRALPVVTGITLAEVAGGAVRTLAADVVVAACGRRMDPPQLPEPPRVHLDEHEEDTGIVYFSRFFDLADGADLPDQSGPIAGDLGYLKYGVFPGDNRTFSITLAAATHDDELRSRLLDPDAFLRIAASIPSTAAYVEPSRATAATEVHVMARLINRDRRFVDEGGRPLVGGLHAVGDAHTCTNPLYGRGCSLAMVQAQLVADALADHGLDHEARGRAYEAASDAEVGPWYRAAVAQDRMNRTAAGGNAGGEPSGPDGAGADGAESAEHPMVGFIRDGIRPAVRLDPVVFRAFLRMLNLLESPDSLMTDPDVLARVMTVFQERDQRDPEPSLGPDRDEVLALI